MRLGNPMPPPVPHRGLRPFRAVGPAVGVGWAVAVLLAAALGSVGFNYMASSARFLSEVDRRYERGVTAARLIYAGLAGILVGVLLIVAGGILEAAGAMVAGLVVALGSLVALFIGLILFAIYVSSIADLRVGPFRAPEDFRTAGTLLLVGVVLGIIPLVNLVGSILVLVGVIIIYTSSGRALEELSRALRYAPAPLY